MAGLSSSQSLTANKLDDMYHSKTGFTLNGEDANKVRQIVGHCKEILTGPYNKDNKAISKSVFFGLFSFLLELDKNPNVSNNANLLNDIGKYLWVPDK